MDETAASTPATSALSRQFVADTSWLGSRIDVLPLFARKHDTFINLLRELTDEDWATPTVCPGWTVHDVAAHVLADYVGRLSMHRDTFSPLRPLAGEAFPAFIHRINDEWVTAARRISPSLLIDLLSVTGRQLIDFWNTIDPDAVGWVVSWAGPDPAPAWLDAARDFSEYWTHHQQISEATRRPDPTQTEFLPIVLDTFMRALPHTLRDTEAVEGTVVAVTTTGAAGGTWTCVRTAERWVLRAGSDSRPAAEVQFDADTAWRLCTRGITPQQAKDRAIIHGDERLAESALTMVSIIY
ncbi:maleylpyruvate isomerase family mycothiol-dependent enzyme [Saccharomonospora sp. NPDC006951]